jgi:hypothetical protein
MAVQTTLLFTRPFEQVEPGLGVGQPVPAGWRTIADWELLIFVGFSGVGKTTTLDLLTGGRDDLRLLPDRRVLVDKLVIEQMQALDGTREQTVNRLQRYEYMFRYRAEFPGGLGHALTQLHLDPAVTPRYVIFNGLRGENEVGHAIEALPRAKFVWLDAPRFVRIGRMLRRNDPHDRVGSQSARRIETVNLTDFGTLGVPEAAELQLFSADEEQALLELVRRGEVEAGDLQDKLKILVEERRSYDETAMRALLTEQAADRTLIVDTTISSPPEVVRQVTSRVFG